MPVSQVTATELAAAMAADPGLTLVDVRSPEEYAGGHVLGSQLVPMHTVPVRVQDLPSGSPVYLICHSGGRSMQVALWLDQHGYDAVNVEGGIVAWAMSGHPVVT